MSLRRSPLPLCLVAAWLAGASLSAAAAPPTHGRGTPATRPTQAAYGDDALSDSVRRVERSTRSQVLSAERVPFDGRDVNRIKTVDANGRVRVFMDDPPRNTPPPDRNPPTRGNDD